MKQSNALWPKGVCGGMYGDNITTDVHPSEEHAHAVCDGLWCDGLGGERKIFPLKTWVSDVQQPPVIPDDDEE